MKYILYLALIAAFVAGGWYVAKRQGWIPDTNQNDLHAGDESQLEEFELQHNQPAENPTTGAAVTISSSTSTDGGNTTTSTETPSTPDSARVIEVTGSNFAFSPSTITAKKGEKIKIVFKNEGGFHDWVLDEFNAKTPRIQGNETAEVEFTADKTGQFEYYCSVGTHRAMGMKGTLIVTEQPD